MNWSQHQLIATISPTGVAFRVECNHRPDDRTRPCWTSDEPDECRLAVLELLDPAGWLRGEVDVPVGMIIESDSDVLPRIRLT